MALDCRLSIISELKNNLGRYTSNVNRRVVSQYC